MDTASKAVVDKDEAAGSDVADESSDGIVGHKRRGIRLKQDLD